MKLKKEKPKKTTYTTLNEIEYEIDFIKEQIIQLEEKYYFLKKIYKNLDSYDIPFSKEELFENMPKMNFLITKTKIIEEPIFPETSDTKELLTDFVKFINYLNGFTGSFDEDLIKKYLTLQEKKRANNGSESIYDSLGFRLSLTKFYY